MNPLAKELNDTLAGTIAGRLLSEYGTRMYFPKGIISQSAEAKVKATRYNATIGIATAHGSAMCIPAVFSAFSDSLTADDVFPYAPTAGEMALRKLWLEQMVRKNPSMKGKRSRAHRLWTDPLHQHTASLFLDKGQSIIVPDMYWGNYNLVFAEQREAKMVSFPLFANDRLNIDGLAKAIDSVPGDRCAMILNFPNNPTGYTPTLDEAKALVAMLVDKANSGRPLLVFTDDAYFGCSLKRTPARIVIRPLVRSP